jgi:hypothetical protein
VVRTDLFGLDQLWTWSTEKNKRTVKNHKKPEEEENQPKAKRKKKDAQSPSAQPKRRKRSALGGNGQLPPLPPPSYTFLVASDLSCAQAVKPTYMSREWAADEQQSLWDPYGYVMQDRRERRRRLGVTMRQREIKDLEELRHLAIPSVRKDDQLIRCIGTGNETVHSCLGRLI